ncbi:hypothetical protein [Larkinella humicola]|uniref:Uncharacterized protein n=1 Tax=Larkinella humicola TaxID=2607654 RepID=A0A5N1JMV1_9BACT|nr:hypothetical protein [Larkinella humicola]KAA9354587.1 hypothetical protein F0P93_08235 [Larkinella humicola]
MNTKLAFPTHSVADQPSALNWRTRYNRALSVLETGDYRFTVMVALLIIQSCIITPASLLVFQYFDFGYSDIFAGIAVVSFFVVLVSNLGLLSVRFCVQLFIVNVLIHLVMLAIHFLH